MKMIISDLTNEELMLLKNIMKLKYNNMNKLKKLMDLGDLEDFIEGYLFACDRFEILTPKNKIMLHGAEFAIAQITLAMETFDRRLL